MKNIKVKVIGLAVLLLLAIPGMLLLDEYQRKVIISKKYLEVIELNLIGKSASNATSILENNGFPVFASTLNPKTGEAFNLLIRLYPKSSIRTLFSDFYGAEVDERRIWTMLELDANHIVKNVRSK